MVGQNTQVRRRCRLKKKKKTHTHTQTNNRKYMQTIQSKGKEQKIGQLEFPQKLGIRLGVPSSTMYTTVLHIRI